MTTKIQRSTSATSQGTRSGSEDGFALPMTIFLVTLITIMLATAFTRTAVEHQLSASSQRSVRALAVAQSGLQAFFGDTSTTRPVTGDSVRYNVVGGYAWIFPEELKIPTDTLADFVYIIRAEGSYIEPAMGSEPQARRAIAQFARWRQAVTSPAVFTTALDYGFDGTDATITINGADACAGSGIGGVWSRGGANSVTGAGGTVLPNETQSGTPIGVINLLGLDWAAIEAGDFTADHTSLATADGDPNYDSYLISGDASIGGITGTGLLIVLGRLLSQGFTWNGVVLVGRDLDLQAGFTTINGTVVTGLDEIFGNVGLVNTWSDETTGINVSYNSCNVAQAFENLRRFVPMDNAWVDNWATY